MGSEQSKLSNSEIKLLKKSTKYTKKDLTSWYKTFKKDNPNGQMSQKSFTEVYQELFPNGNASFFAKRVFKIFDTNNDGFLDFREFAVAFSTLQKGSVEEKFDFTFRIFDINEDGVISKDEVTEIIGFLYAMHGLESPYDNYVGLANKKQTTDMQNDPNIDMKRNLSSTSNTSTNSVTARLKSDSVFKLLDLDDDGTITRKELENGYKMDPIFEKTLSLNSIDEEDDIFSRYGDD